jgi:hypothetical protein
MSIPTHPRRLHQFHIPKPILVTSALIIAAVILFLYTDLLTDSRRSAHEAVLQVLHDESLFATHVRGDEESRSQFRQCRPSEIRFVTQQILGSPVIFECFPNSSGQRIQITVTVPPYMEVKTTPKR